MVRGDPMSNLNSKRAQPERGLPHGVTRRELILSAGAGVVALALGRPAAGRDDKHDDRDDDDRVQPSGTVPAGSAEVVIDDDDADGFSPGTITIDAGQSVTWVNMDKHAHTATGADFDTGPMDPDELATVRFDVPGSYPYSCQFHPVMTGVVEVRDRAGQVPNSTSATPDASPQATPQAVVEVSIKDLTFAPADLEIQVGTTVRWTNHDAFPHTVRSVNDTFDSGILEETDTFDYTFDTSGTFNYICALHPTMKGSVVVTG